MKPPLAVTLYPSRRGGISLAGCLGFYYGDWREQTGIALREKNEQVSTTHPFPPLAGTGKSEWLDKASPSVVSVAWSHETGAGIARASQRSYGHGCPPIPENSWALCICRALLNSFCPTTRRIRAVIAMRPRFYGIVSKLQRRDWNPKAVSNALGRVYSPLANQREFFREPMSPHGTGGEFLLLHRRGGDRFRLLYEILVFNESNALINGVFLPVDTRQADRLCCGLGECRVNPVDFVGINAGVQFLGVAARIDNHIRPLGLLELNVAHKRKTRRGLITAGFWHFHVLPDYLPEPLSGGRALKANRNKTADASTIRISPRLSTPIPIYFQPIGGDKRLSLPPALRR